MVPIHFVLPKIPKYKEKEDQMKYFNNYKIHISLRGESPAIKCGVFELNLNGAIEMKYNRIPTISIKSWPKLKNAFLK